MKVFFIQDGFCFHYHPEYETAKQASQNFHPSFQFVDAPDYVFEGWGFDDSATGDDRFLKPQPEEGWLYDDETGCMYREGEEKPIPQPTQEELMRLYETLKQNGGFENMKEILAFVESDNLQIMTRGGGA